MVAIIMFLILFAIIFLLTHTSPPLKNNTDCSYNGRAEGAILKNVNHNSIRPPDPKPLPTSKDMYAQCIGVYDNVEERKHYPPKGARLGVCRAKTQDININLSASMRNIIEAKRILCKADSNIKCPDFDIVKE